ncbi:MAG: hypothetical protein GF334_04165 [Candidatus Altiarchaeales archaeon]|nr:hypothetical protein [Candidatus Altiarchaeales archaeon]
MVGKKHSIKPVGVGEKLHVRVDCESCFRGESVFDYEKNIGSRKFNTSFQECPVCGKLLCEVCVPEEKTCIACGGKTAKIHPEDIYVCSVCIENWWDEGGLCGKHCKYQK